MVAVLAVSLPAAAPALAAGSGAVRVTPAAQSLAGPGSSFTVQVTSNADTTTSGIQATVAFSKSVLQITSVSRPVGTDWGTLEGTTAPAFLGSKGDLSTASALQQQVAEANGTGAFSAASFFSPPTTLSANADHTFLNITFIVVACPATGTTTDISLPTGPANTVLNDANGDAVAIQTYSSQVTPCANGTGNTTTQLRASMGAGFLEISVPANVTIPLIRQVNNSVNVPVSVYSDGIWTLFVSDAMTPAGKLASDRGKMIDGVPTTKRLASPMQAQVGAGALRTLDQPMASNILLNDESTRTPIVTLYQNVGPSDPGGAYSIGVMFTATSGF